MNCERIRELVSDALDGVLASSVTDRFHAHLDTCPPCRTYYMELKESLLLLEELPTVEVGDDFDRAVWARIRSEEEPRSVVQSLEERLEMLRLRFSFGTGLMRWSPVAAAALVLLGLAMVASPPGVAPVADESLSGTDVAVVPSSDAELPPGASSRRTDDAADDATVADATNGFQEQEYVSGMPRAVEHYLENGQELRLANPERYEHSNYSYPLRQIPDPGFTDSFASSNGRFSGFSWRRGGPETIGTPVGTTAPVSSGGTDARVMVLEF